VRAVAGIRGHQPPGEHQALRDASAKRAAVTAVFSMRMAEFFDETRATPAQLRDQLVGGRSLTEEIYDRAVARGEVDPARLTPGSRRWRSTCCATSWC
jgi:hypothetical protein